MNNRYSPNHVFAIGSVGEYQFSPSFAAGRVFLDEMLYPFVCACQTTCPLAIQPGLLIELLIDGKACTRDIFFPNAHGKTASMEEMAHANVADNRNSNANRGTPERLQFPASGKRGRDRGGSDENLMEGYHTNAGGDA